MALKKRIDYIQSFRRTEVEIARKCPKSSKIAVFRLSVNEQPIEINHITGNRKPISSKNGK